MPTTDKMNDPEGLRAWARRYIERFGWAVAPVWLDSPNGVGRVCGCPKGATCETPGKHLVSGAGVAHESGEVGEVFRDDLIDVGIAVMTGSDSGLLVLDVRQDAALTRARFEMNGSVLTQVTPSLGQHWFFGLAADAPVFGIRPETELVNGCTVLGEGTFAVVGPRHGYYWAGGAANLAGMKPSPLPPNLALRLAREKLIKPTEDIHPDDPWRASPGQRLSPEVTPRSYTRLGDLRRIVDEWGDILTWTPGVGWRVWVDGGWQGGDRAERELTSMALRLGVVHRREAEEAKKRKGEDNSLAKQALKWSTRSATRPTKGLLTDLAGDARVLVPSTRFWDTQGHLAGLPDPDNVGRLVDLRTGEVLREPGQNARMLRISKRLGVDYGGESLAALWEHSVWFKRYITDLTRANGEEWVRLLQRAAGASLYGAEGTPKIDDSVFILKGAPGCGKSTFASCFGAVAGDHAKAMNSNLLFGGRGNSEFLIAAVRDYRVLTLSEPKSGQRELNTELLKAISGGDDQTGRDPYAREEVSFTPECSIWIATNHPLVVDDDAVWRRLRPMEFSSSLDFSGDAAAPEMRQALTHDQLELRTALAWFLVGSRQFHVEGWGSTALWKEAAEIEKTSNDPLARFLVESVMVTKVAADRFTDKEMLTALERWRMANPDVVVGKAGGVLREELVHRIERAGVRFDRKSCVFTGATLKP